MAKEVPESSARMEKDEKKASYLNGSVNTVSVLKWRERFKMERCNKSYAVKGGSSK